MSLVFIALQFLHRNIFYKEVLMFCGVEIILLSLVCTRHVCSVLVAVRRQGGSRNAVATPGGRNCDVLLMDGT